MWGIIGSVLTLSWMTSYPIFWFSNLADSVLEVCLGLLLGVGVLKTFIKDPTAGAKMDQTIAKLSPFQGTLGLVAIGVGIWMVVVSILFGVA